MSEFHESDYNVVQGEPVPDYQLTAFHIHTTNSDAFETSHQAVDRAARLGVSVVIFQDHNNGDSYAQTINYAAEMSPSILIIPGREVNSKNGHIGSIGTEIDIPRNLPAEDTNRIITESGGKAIALHAGDKVTNSVSLDTIRRVNSNPDPMTHFTFIEVFNGATLKIENLVRRPLTGRIVKLVSKRARRVDFASTKAQDFMEKEGEIYNLNYLNGPDAHYGKDIEDVLMGYPEGDNFLEAALNGRTWTLVKRKMHYPSLRKFQEQKKLDRPEDL